MRDRGGPGADRGLPAAPGRSAAHRPRWSSPRGPLVVIGLTALVLQGVIVGTALLGLSEVDEAHREVARITAAQRSFQDADMAHDAMRADLLYLVVLQRPPGVPAAAALARTGQSLTRDVADFRTQLDRVAVTALPPALAGQIGQLRPSQEAYAADTEELGRRTLTDLPAVEAALPTLDTAFRQLALAQARVTDDMAGEAARRQSRAEDQAQSARMRLVLAVVVAIAGSLGLTFLLGRMGRRLAALLASERGVAETLQRALLPERLPELPGVRLAARYVAGGAGAEVGGDWYDVIPLPGGEVGLVMGDVVGHDLRAASVMGQMRHALRAYAIEGLPPEQALDRLNRLCLRHDLGEMATVVYAVLDPVLRTLCIANAGHYPPLLVHGSTRLHLEGKAFPPVGAARNVQYESALHQLPADALLVLYTDGLVERRGVGVEDGMQRLTALVAPSEAGLDALCEDLLSAMLGDAPPQDDVALLLVQPQGALGPRLDLLWPARPERLVVLRRLLERWLHEAGADEDEVYEILVSCSEAVTNAVEHAYGPGEAEFQVRCEVVDGTVELYVRDWGQWREARGRDRGRGLDLVRALMDDVHVEHTTDGTEICMRRRLLLAAERLEPVPERSS